MANNENEPEEQLIVVLKDNLTDPNSTNRSGDNWIFEDMPRDDLTKNSYPRISVMMVTETAEQIELYGTMMYSPRLQVDIWVWGGNDGQDSMKLTIDGDVYEGHKLLTYLARQVKNTLDDYKSTLEEDTTKMWNYTLLASVNMWQDPKKKQIIRHRIEVGYDSFRGT